LAVFWMLGLHARTREEAETCLVFFAHKRLLVEAVDVALEVFIQEKDDGWAVGVLPYGMSQGTPSAVPELTEEPAPMAVARTFDAWLLDAPPFVAGWFGREAFDLFVPRLDIGPAGIGGLVVDEATWVSLGRPPEALPTSAGRRAWARTKAP
jgi:hypothetical protein